MTVWVLAVVVLFGGTLAEGALVVCVGEDGHADVEIIATGCCSLGNAESSNRDVPGVRSAAGGCAGCVDLGLNVESLKAAPKPLPVPDRTISRKGIGDGSLNCFRLTETETTSDHDWVSEVLSSMVLLT